MVLPKTQQLQLQGPISKQLARYGEKFEFALQIFGCFVFRLGLNKGFL